MTIQEIRAHFPALAGETVYLENAGGSQVPRCVADAMHHYLTQTYVQLGAPYRVARASTETVAQAHEFVNELMNGTGIGAVALGPSSTQLVTMLAECYSRKLQPGDEIIICETAHEANAGPWEKLARFGIVIKTWRVDPETAQCSLDDLASLLSAKTKLVTFPHVSNLLGEVVDVKSITDLCHQAGAKVVVDGVAFAPHRAIDVKGWGVDWYFYSTYKVYGPHMAALFGRSEAWAELEGPNHFFLPNDIYKFELGGPCHEGCAGLLGLKDYLSFFGRGNASTAFQFIAELEIPLQARFLDYLNSRPDIRIIGPKTAGWERVPTISFLVHGIRPDKVCEAADRANIGIRWGHMYAYRLCQALGIDTDWGVIRVSALHYNSIEEIDRLMDVLEAHARA